MAGITIDNCKAPTYDEFPKLVKIGAAKLFEEAREIKIQMAALKDQLAALNPRIQAKLETALADDVTSVRYADLLITRRKGSERRSLDKAWAVKKLVAKGVTKAEIDEHTKVSVVEPGVSVRLLGESEGDD